MDFREDQLLKVSTNRPGRSTILTLTKPCRRPGTAVRAALGAYPTIDP